MTIFDIIIFIVYDLLIKKSIAINDISFSVYYVTIKVNSSHSWFTLSHTMAHAENRPPPWCFFIVFLRGFFVLFFKIHFMK